MSTNRNTIRRSQSAHRDVESGADTQTQTHKRRTQPTISKNGGVLDQELMQAKATQLAEDIANISERLRLQPPGRSRARDRTVQDNFHAGGAHVGRLLKLCHAIFRAVRGGGLCPTMASTSATSACCLQIRGRAAREVLAGVRRICSRNIQHSDMSH